MASSCQISEAIINAEAASCSSESQEAVLLLELRERYEEQQRRLACPSCGEEPFLD
jgi:hypothetical protein